MNTEKRKKYLKEYYQDNKEKCNAQSLAWTRANREKARASVKKHRDSNREQTSARMAAYYQNLKNNPEYIEYNKRQNAAWARNNPDKVNAKNARRRSSQLLRTPEWLTASDLINIQGFYTMSTRVSKCLGIEHHVDHIIPLKGKHVSGLHVPWNLQVLPAKLNTSKGNRL